MGGATGFDRYLCNVSVGDTGNELQSLEEVESGASDASLRVFDRLRVPSIFLPGRRSGSWSNSLPRTVPWSWHLPRRERGPHGTGHIGSFGEVADHLRVDEAVMMTKQLLRLYSQKAWAY